MSGSESYSFDLQLKAVSPSDKERVVATVAFIKGVATLDLSSSPLSAQLLVMSLNESSLFESMLSYVRHAFLPYSRAWMSGSAGEEEKKEADLGQLQAHSLLHHTTKWELLLCVCVCVCVSAAQRCIFDRLSHSS